MAKLPKTIVREDARLEKAATAATEELASLRWHWTVDEDNPHRVSIREYAASIGRAEPNVRHMVNGYAEWLDKGAIAGDRTDLADTIALNKFGSDKRAIVEAYTKATGVKPGNAVTGTNPHRSKVNAAHEIAKRRAADNGTSIADEAKDAVKWVVTGEKAKNRKRQNRKADHDYEFVMTYSALGRARKALVDAIEHMKGVQFRDEEREELVKEFDRLRAASRLAALELKGNSGTDWDAELAKLSAGGAK